MAFKGFQRLHGTIRELGKVPAQAAKEASRAIASLIQEGFDAGTDPYGRPWAALRPATLAKGRHHPPLTDSGAMRASVDVHPSAGAGIEVSIDSPIATFHQTGTANMAQRQIMPQSGGLPATWSKAIGDAVANATKNAMG